MGIVVSVIFSYVFLYPPLAVFTDVFTVVPDSWPEIALMLFGTNGVMIVLGHYVLKERKQRAARDVELVGTTDGAEPWRSSVSS